ncbi:hypothetical protein SCHPADRAFT_943659 [Schizopora paradoxa]|uniref:Uncharacterized protein n=1 Tax=Schizopora paradoxa TaxID=27342 RepID=A0A0H2RJ46_9AGAM|nr:hypothetical protein SCHPADRAFT_943659 [Schizopora paradoxa]
MTDAQNALGLSLDVAGPSLWEGFDSSLGGCDELVQELGFSEEDSRVSTVMAPYGQYDHIADFMSTGALDLALNNTRFEAFSGERANSGDMAEQPRQFGSQNDAYDAQNIPPHAPAGSFYSTYTSGTLEENHVPESQENASPDNEADTDNFIYPLSIGDTPSIPDKTLLISLFPGSVQQQQNAVAGPSNPARPDSTLYEPHNPAYMFGQDRIEPLVSHFTFAVPLSAPIPRLSQSQSAIGYSSDLATDIEGQFPGANATAPDSLHGTGPNLQSQCSPPPFFPVTRSDAKGKGKVPAANVSQHLRLHLPLIQTHNAFRNGIVTKYGLVTPEESKAPSLSTSPTLPLVSENYFSYASFGTQAQSTAFQAPVEGVSGFMNQSGALPLPTPFTPAAQPLQPTKRFSKKRKAPEDGFGVQGQASEIKCPGKNCDKTFKNGQGQAEALLQHLDVDHPNCDAVVCPNAVLCGKVLLSRPDSLRRHYKTHGCQTEVQKACGLPAKLRGSKNNDWSEERLAQAFAYKLWRPFIIENAFVKRCKTSRNPESGSKRPKCSD